VNEVTEPSGYDLKLQEEIDQRFYSKGKSSHSNCPKKLCSLAFKTILNISNPLVKCKIDKQK